jgi:hypothetical protein
MEKLALLTVLFIALLVLAVGKWIVDGLKRIANPTRRPRYA